MTNARISKRAMHSFLIVFILFLLVYPHQAKSADDNAPYFVSELWPEEGRPKYRAKINLTLHAEPKHESEIVNGTILKGELIDFTETRYVTSKPKSVILDQDVEFPDATSYGKIKYLSGNDYYNSGKRTVLYVKKGQEVKILQYRAEGTYLLEYNNIVFSAMCPICTKGRRPETELWHLVKRGELKGWILINGQNVEAFD